MDFITGTAQPPRFFICSGCTLPDAVRRWFCTAGLDYHRTGQGWLEAARHPEFQQTPG